MKNEHEPLNDSPYAPMAWRNFFWWDLSKDAAKAGHVNAVGEVDPQYKDDLEDNIFHMLASRPETGNVIATALSGFNMCDFMPLISQFEIQGRQIFQLSDGLKEMLELTDQGQCTMQDLSLPYEAFYIHFGKPNKFSSDFPDCNEGNYVTGAFVSRSKIGTESKLNFVLANVVNGVLMDPPLHVFDILSHESKMTLDDAFDSATSRRFDFVAQKLRLGEGDPLAEDLSKHCLYTGEVLKRYMPMIMNTLFYLESMHEHTIKTLGDDTPKDLLDTWEKAGKRKYKVESEVTRRGHTVVNLVGSDVLKMNDSVEHGGSTSEKSTHWRRGHFRNQHHGAGFNLVKRILIKPVLVNAKNADPIDVDGHIYKFKAALDVIPKSFNKTSKRNVL